jgi:hypothetical protein
MLELEPFDALALSLHHSPGVYALLIGSGLSHAAGIPTGWEITLDLIRRLAALDGITEHDDWEAWFRDKYGSEPNYSEILDALATTPSERQIILRSYIEPQEGEEARRPTKAHHAIAQLVVNGTVHVIVTTNFDRLIETALREAGIEPTVIASEDALAGATPLVHARCTVIKPNGDYLDTRIKNTESELGSYAPAINSFLDEVFDRFGLVVVGWSGEWDTALRAALLRAPSRRYPLYWAARGPIAPLAQDLIAHRDGRSFAIMDADSFFARLGDTVEALRQAARPHPQSVAMAVALAKRYCRDDRYALEGAEFLAGEVTKIRSFATGKDYPTDPNALLATLVPRSEVLRRACLVSGRWGTREANRVVARAIRSLGFRPEPKGVYIYAPERYYFCASLCFYWALAGAVAREDFATTRSLMHAQITTDAGEEVCVLTLPLSALDSIDWKLLKGLEGHKAPASAFLFGPFGKEITDAAVDPSEAEDLFDHLELLISLEFAHLSLQNKNGPPFWAPIGLYVWKRGARGVFDRLSAYGNLPANHALLQAGLLGGDRPLSADPARRQADRHLRQPGVLRPIPRAPRLGPDHLSEWQIDRAGTPARRRHGGLCGTRGRRRLSLGQSMKTAALSTLLGVGSEIGATGTQNDIVTALRRGS